MTLSDMGRAVIVCDDCNKEITSVRDHFMGSNLLNILSSPMNKQFPDHIDHDLSIIIPDKENEK